jgi:hypothetical protein
MTKLIPDNDQLPGYCSIAIPPLTTEQLARIEECVTPGSSRPSRGIEMFSEKSLVGKGLRVLLLVDKTNIVEYAGERKAKFVTKDAVRFEAMAACLMEKLNNDTKTGVVDNSNNNIRKIVLLASDGTICRKNTLPKLHANSTVVMRFPLRTTTTTTEEESEESKEEEEEVSDETVATYNLLSLYQLSRTHLVLYILKGRR